MHLDDVGPFKWNHQKKKKTKNVKLTPLVIDCFHVTRGTGSVTTGPQTCQKACHQVCQIHPEHDPTQLKPYVCWVKVSLSERERLVSPARPDTVDEVAASCKVTASVTSGCVSHRSHYQCRTMGVLLKWLVSVCPFHDLKHTHINTERISIRC